MLLLKKHTVEITHCRRQRNGDSRIKPDFMKSLEHRLVASPLKTKIMAHLNVFF